jgi:hypothetical protein
MSLSHKTENIAQISEQSDNINPASHRTDANVDSTSDRAYILGPSHLNKSIGRTSENTDPMFPTCHMNDQIGLTSSHRTDIGLGPTTERIYISSASDRNENYSSACEIDDALPSTSERVFIPTMVHSMTPSSESSYVPANSQRMYIQNPVISMDEFPS